MKSNNPVSTRALSIWIFSIIGAVLFLIAVGGITRLTGSGLSITEWKPLMGTIPPLTDHDWLEVFHKYTESPQYKLVNQGMSLDEFKFIFFWEYIHRFIARSIGLLIIFPLVLWWNRLTRSLKIKMFIAMLLGGTQGFIGWYMVKSGLVNEPRVSHFRLATHLISALIILNFLFWVFKTEVTKARIKLDRYDAFTIALLLIQITYGAFTAGLRAGHMYNEFPMMGGSFLPPGFLGLSPWIINFFENPAAIQWFHRWLGISLLTLLVFELKKKNWFFASALLIQITLGLATLLMHVPMPLGVTHQVMAFILFLIKFNSVFKKST